MIDQTKIDRINELARKAKTEGLSAGEAAERDALRKEYVAAVRESLTGQLEHTWIQDPNGRRRKLKKKAQPPR